MSGSFSFFFLLILSFFFFFLLILPFFFFFPPHRDFERDVREAIGTAQKDLKGLHAYAKKMKKDKSPEFVAAQQAEAAFKDKTHKELCDMELALKEKLVSAHDDYMTKLHAVQIEEAEEVVTAQRSELEDLHERTLALLDARISAEGVALRNHDRKNVKKNKSKSDWQKHKREQV